MAFALLEHGRMGRAGIEPDIQDIGCLFIVLGIWPQQLHRIQLAPGINAILLDAERDFFQQTRGFWMWFAGFLVDEKRNGHTPHTLARNTPIGAIADHAIDSSATP